jgi:hypothetical protein
MPRRSPSLSRRRSPHSSSLRKQGTHSHRRQLLESRLAPALNREAAAYGSLLSQGRQAGLSIQFFKQPQLRDLAAGYARVLLRNSHPLQSEGAGNAGRPMRPIAACAMIVVERTRVSQVTPESPGIPRAMVYGLYRALPGEPGFLATVTPEKLASQELDTSVGVSGPHDFAVRISAVRQKRHPRPPHPVPRP